MASKYNLSILLDLHGTPGSQNGIDHSGCSLSASWLVDFDSMSNISNSKPSSSADSFLKDDTLRLHDEPLHSFRNVILTLQTIEAMAKRYGQHRSLLGFELVNEPSRFYSDNMHDVILQFYKESFRSIFKTGCFYFGTVLSQRITV